MPEWLVVLSWVGALLGVASALLVTADLLAGQAQKTWIMDLVWPVTALWSGPLGAWAYFRLAGFVTSYPVNWLLLKKGVKEAM